MDAEETPLITESQDTKAVSNAIPLENDISDLASNIVNSSPTENVQDSFSDLSSSIGVTQVKNESYSDISDEVAPPTPTNSSHSPDAPFDTKRKHFKMDKELANDKKDYKKRQMGRDHRRWHHNHNRRGRFHAERRRTEYEVIPSQIPPLLEGIEVPPPDPLLLEAIDSDPPGIVRIADGMKEVRFYGETAIVMLDWDDPRDIYFQAGSRRVIVDDLEIITLPFNAPYTAYTLYNGRKINIRLGSPTRDLYIDGRFFDARFGGSPIEVPIDGVYHRFQLGGPLPHMCLGSKKRIDLVVGRITMVVDEQISNLVYLDSKPQKFDINGTPFIIKFNETLTCASINGKMFRIEFGGRPLHISCVGTVHTLRFSSLPAGVLPGYINFIELEYQTTFDPYTKTHIFDALSIAQPPVLQDFHNYHYHYHYHCTSMESPQINLPSLLPQKNEIMPTVEYKVLMEPPPVDTGVIDVKGLFEKLVEKGIVPAAIEPKPNKPKKCHLPTDSISVDFTKPASLKLRNPKEINDLHKGNQCESCGMRFIYRNTWYINHLRYHEEDGKPNEIRSRRWWSHSSEFLMEFDEDLPSWFKRNGKISYGKKPASSESGEEFTPFVPGEECSDSSFLPNTTYPENKSTEPETKKEWSLANFCSMSSLLGFSSGSDDSVKACEPNPSDEVIVVGETTPPTETIVVDDSSVEEVTNSEGLIDIVSEEEVEPGEIVEGRNEPEGDILEIVDIKPIIETIVVSDDEIEEGEIIDGPEPIPLMDIDFSKIKIKHEKFEDSYFPSSKFPTERWSIDGNSEYKSANVMKPRKIKVNIPSMARRYQKRRDNRRRTRRRQEYHRKREIIPTPASVKPKIANSMQSVNICKSKGRETSALCSIM